MARDLTQQRVKTSLEKAGIQPLKFTKDLGKALLFDSLPYQFTDSMPALGSIFETAGDMVGSLRSFSTKKNDLLKRGVDAAFQNEAVSAVAGQAKTLLGQIKSGKIYDPKRNQSAFGDDMFGNINDSLMDSFGGVDMSFDDEGEYVETVSQSDSNDYKVQYDIAEAQNRADDNRTVATISAIGEATESTMKWNQALIQSSMQLQAKFHNEQLNMATNQLTMTSALYETTNKRLTEIVSVMTEANKTLLADVSDIKKNIAKMAKSYDAPSARYYEDKNPLANGFSLANYTKQIKKNASDSMLGLAGTFASMIPMLISMDDRKKANPILWLTDLLAGQIVPKSTRERMKQTDKMFDAFAMGMLNRLKEKADNSGFDSLWSIFGDIFGYRSEYKVNLNPQHELRKVAQWSGKDSKALTDVIPTQLAQIISLMSGQPARLFDYSSGTFKDAYSTAGKILRGLNKPSMMSDSADILKARAKGINFGTSQQNDAFQAILDNYLSEAIKSGKLVNPYAEGFDPLEGLSNSRIRRMGLDPSQVRPAITALLRTLNNNELMSLGKDITMARSDASSESVSIKNDLVKSSMIMAFSQSAMAGLDDKGQDRLLRYMVDFSNRGGDFNATQMSRFVRRYTNRFKESKDGTPDILKEIRNTLRRGIITYSYDAQSYGTTRKDLPGLNAAISEMSLGSAKNLKPRDRTNSGSASSRSDILQKVLQHRHSRNSKAKLTDEQLQAYADQLGVSVKELGQMAEQTLYSTSDKINIIDLDDENAMYAAFKNIKVEKREYEDDDVLSKAKKATGGQFAKAKARIAGFLDNLRSPFKLVEKAMDSMDAAMFRILYGKLPDDKQDDRSVMDLIRDTLQGQIDTFGKFLNDKFDWIDEKLFGDEGLAKKGAKRLKSYVFGDEGEDGLLSGGIFSDEANSAKATGKSFKTTLLQTVRQQILGEEVEGKPYRAFNGEIKQKKQYRGGIFEPIRGSIDTINEMLFGGAMEYTDSKKAADLVMQDLEKSSGGMALGTIGGAALGTHIGLLAGGRGILGGLLTPGGMVFSALLGAFGGMIGSSNRLNEYLFGKKDEDGNRHGGALSEEVTKGLTKYIPNIGGGAIIGATLGSIGILPFGMGKIAGAILGSMGGMVNASDDFKEFMFGKKDDASSGIISKNFRTTLMGMIPGWMIGTKAAGALAGLFPTLAGAGLPALGFLPAITLGGVATLTGGLMGALSKERLDEWLFGKLNAESGKREGGAFSDLMDKARDKVLQPLVDGANAMGESVNNWFKDAIYENIKDSISPITELFGRLATKAHNKLIDIGDIVRGAISTAFEKTAGRFFKWIIGGLIGKKNEETGKREGGILRAMVAAPFKVMGGLGRFTTKAINTYDHYNAQRVEEQYLASHGLDSIDQLSDEQVAELDELKTQADRKSGKTKFWDTYREKGAKQREEWNQKVEENRKKREAAEQAKAQTESVQSALVDSGLTNSNNLIVENTERTADAIETIMGILSGKGDMTQSGGLVDENGNPLTSSAGGGKTGGKPNAAGQKARYLKNLYEKADKAMEGKADAKEIADRLIKTESSKNPFWTEDITKTVNEVYQLNGAAAAEQGKATAEAIGNTGLLDAASIFGEDTFISSVIKFFSNGGLKTALAEIIMLGIGLAFAGSVFGKKEAEEAEDDYEERVRMIAQQTGLSEQEVIERGLVETPEEAAANAEPTTFKSLVKRGVKNIGPQHLYQSIVGHGRKVLTSGKSKFGNLFGKFKNAVTGRGGAHAANKAAKEGAEDFTAKDIKKAVKEGAQEGLEKITKNPIVKNMIGENGESLAKATNEVLESSDDAFEAIYRQCKEMLGEGAQESLETFASAATKAANTSMGEAAEEILESGGAQAAKAGIKGAKWLPPLKLLQIDKIILATFTIAEFIGGCRDANKYFGVSEKDVTPAMMGASGTVRCVMEFICELLEYKFGVKAIAASILVQSAFDYGYFARAIYNKISTKGAKTRLSNKQQHLERMTQAYNQSHNTQYSVEEFSRRIDSNQSLGEIITDQTLDSRHASKRWVEVRVINIIRDLNTQFDFYSVVKKNKIENAIRRIIKNMAEYTSTGTLDAICGKTYTTGERFTTEDVDFKITQTIKAQSAYMEGYNNVMALLYNNTVDISETYKICAGLASAIQSITNGAVDAKMAAAELISSLDKNDVNGVSADNPSIYHSSGGTISNIIKKFNSNRATKAEANQLYEATKTAATVHSSVSSARDTAIDKIKNAIASMGKGRFGRGYFSQTDPTWNQFDPDMKNSGCGPTVAAMMASHYGKGRWGGFANPAEADYMSRNMPGMRDSDGGTNPAFFERYGASKGIPMRAGAPDSNAIRGTLRNGGAVGLMGQGGAYGSNMHYMMADGIDSRDNVHLVDPYGGKATTRSLRSLAGNTSRAIYGSGRWGRSAASQIPSTARRSRAYIIKPTDTEATILGKETALHGRIIDDQGKGRGLFGRGRWGRGTAKEQAAKILQVAENEVGYLEKASDSQLDDKKANPGKGPSNYTKYGKWFGLNGGKGAPWCAMFVSWCAAQAGVSTDVIPKTASCGVFYDKYKAMGTYHHKSENYIPQPGDIALFGEVRAGWAQHTGLVYSSDGSTLITIEGNTSNSNTGEGDGVHKKEYSNYKSSNWVTGFCTPAYDGNEVPFEGGSTSGENGEMDAGSKASYTGVFGSLHQALDSINSAIDQAFAPLFGDSGSTSGDASSSGSATTTSGGVPGSASGDSGSALTGGSEYPKYNLSDAQKSFIAGMISEEQDESDIVAQRMEASQVVNLAEVERGKSTAQGIYDVANSTWYAQKSRNRGHAGNYSPAAMQAVNEVIVNGQRTLPRYVTEHDFYGDINNINLNPRSEAGKQNRKNIKLGDVIKNNMGSVYKFYKFAGKNGAEGSGDPFGWKEQFYDKYKDDVPWGSGRNAMSVYRNGGIQEQVNAINYGMGKAQAAATMSRQLNEIKTTTTAIANAAKTTGEGVYSAMIGQIAEGISTMVTLLSDIRDQGRTFAEKSSAKQLPVADKMSNQSSLSPDDPGTVSMRKMVVRT